MSITQLVLIWVLLGFLLTWMFTFAILAIRPQSRKNIKLEDQPSQPMPAISGPTILQVIASQPLPSHVRAGQEPPGV
jgi:hypothetical protein